MNSTENKLPVDGDRREFLEQCRTLLAGLAVVGLGAPLLQGCETERLLNPAAQGSTLVVDVSTLDADGKFLITQTPTNSPVLVVRNGLGSYLALSMICTHESCPVAEPVDRVMTCPCHLSQFNIDGSVVRGPATSPLKQYAAALNPAGQLVVTL